MIQPAQDRQRVFISTADGIEAELLAPVARPGVSATACPMWMLAADASARMPGQ